jgi:hypothetical protein
MIGQKVEMVKPAASAIFAPWELRGPRLQANTYTVSLRMFFRASSSSAKRMLTARNGFLFKLRPGIHIDEHKLRATGLSFLSSSGEVSLAPTVILF